MSLESSHRDDSNDISFSSILYFLDYLSSGKRFLLSIHSLLPLCRHHAFLLPLLFLFVLLVYVTEVYFQLCFSKERFLLPQLEKIKRLKRYFFTYIELITSLEASCKEEEAN